MDPVTLGVVGGSLIGSALLQYMNSENAADATEAERSKMRALLDKVREPNFDMSTLTPEDYKVVGTYAPQVAPFVEANAPQAVNVDTEDANAAKGAQRSALQQMLAQAKNGQDPILEVQRAKSTRDAAANAQSARNTLDEQLQRRGVGPGAGLGYAGNLQAISDSYQTDALAGQQAAVDAANRRNQAVTGAANLGGQIYGQEASLAEKNANIMNNFNQYIRDARQQQVNNAANTTNEGNRYNLGVAQSTANQNVGNRNNWKVSERDNQNKLLQQQYNNQIGKVGGQNQIAQQAIGDINDRTKQQNTAIQGIGEGISKVGIYNDDKLRKN